jgi:hypothetical protein
MRCFCGQELGSSNAYGWQTCTFANGKIIYAVCFHGIVCINENNDILNKIDILEDLKFSCENHGIGLDEIEQVRKQNRVDALDYVIALLKGKVV